MKCSTAFNEYETESILGEGGAGIVYKAKDLSGKTFAVKILRPQSKTSEKFKRFKNELNFGFKNEHSHVIKVLEYGEVEYKGDPTSFYVMPYFPETLRGLIEKGISSDKALEYYSHILDGVEAAHLQDVWHRDMKPENILYDPESDSLIVADFGIAHFSQEQLYTVVETKKSDKLANFQYAAPEQREKGEQVDFRADIYSLGLILNEMFTGKVPQGTDFMTIEKTSSNYTYLDGIVDSMIKQNPEDRPQSIDEIKQILIGRKNDFISRQRLNKLKKEVVPNYKVENQFVTNPPKIKSIDYRDGRLIIKLDKPVTVDWVDVFQNVNFRHASPAHAVPRNYYIRGNEVSISSREDETQSYIDHFKRYLTYTLEDYTKLKIQENERRKAKERQDLEKRIQDEEQRKRVLKNIKF